MSGIAKTGFVITAADFSRETHCNRRIAGVAAQAPLSPTTSPGFVGVGILESNLTLLVPTHFMTGKAILITLNGIDTV